MQGYFPQYVVEDTVCTLCIHVITNQEIDMIPQHRRQHFGQKGQVSVTSQLKQTIYCLPKATIQIQSSATIIFSAKVQALNNYLGIASDLLASAYVFSRKSIKPKPPTVYVPTNTKHAELMINLARARNRTKEWVNGRGDQEGIPLYFQREAQRLSKQLGVKMVVIKGDELLKEGFRLMHAVGRASKNQPTFINLSYEGNSGSSEWICFVGKGVCFDSGGLNLKSSAGMKPMFLDKHGACSVLSAFQAVVEEKLKVNLTVSMGFVENFISNNSYRPSDIIKSRKGLTVEVSDTDAEGRLVLADCMNWSQQKYKVKVLIELSTLTYIAVVLGSKYAGLFSNSDGLVRELERAGSQINELVWRLPLTEYHHDLLKSEVADLASDPQVRQSQAAKGGAFLQVTGWSFRNLYSKVQSGHTQISLPQLLFQAKELGMDVDCQSNGQEIMLAYDLSQEIYQLFVQSGTEWVHMDIGGTAIVKQVGTGYGTRLLIQYIRNLI